MNGSNKECQLGHGVPEGFRHADSTTHGTKTRHTFGFNTHGTASHEVLLVTETVNGDFLGTEVVLTVPSRAKAEAIAMILNAPENY